MRYDVCFMRTARILEKGVGTGVRVAAAAVKGMASSVAFDATPILVPVLNRSYNGPRLASDFNLQLTKCIGSCHGSVGAPLCR